MYNYGLKYKYRLYICTGNNAKLKQNIMTTLEALKFTAKVTVGTIIKSNKLILRVDKINDDSFEGQTIYKGKERGKTFLSFKTLLNPHCCKDIEILKKDIN